MPRRSHFPATPSVPGARGFSLIEMAVILVILGLVLATVLPRVVETMQEEIAKGERTDVQAVRDEVVGYAIDNCALPDDLEALKDYSAHAAAKFGGEIYYYVDGNLTKTARDTNGTTIDNTSDGAFTVSKGGESTDDVAFIVASKGRNKSVDTTLAANTLTVPAYEKNVSDDMVAFATLSYLKGVTANCEGGGGGSSSGDVSFDSNMDGFTANVGFTTSSPTSPTITVDTSSKTISLGNNIYNGAGCAWYQGESASGNCDNGNCTFGAGIRAVFEFEFDSSSNGDGFVFGIISGEHNNATSCGGNAGSSQGELLGWAGDGVDDRGLVAPKLGIEFDTYYNDCGGNLCNAGSRCDYAARDHAAYVYWGTNAPDCGSGSFQDDNRHGAGSGAADQPANDRNSDWSSGTNTGLDGYLQLSGSSDWMEDASEPWVLRIDVFRNQTANADGNYGYELRAWLSAKSAMPDGFDDMSTDYAQSPQIWDSIELTPTLHHALNYVFFGWTEATGAATQVITLRNFRLGFR
ncbi:MAG: prepilin-type N-terminal cleavage/methylation domain-containing protein [Desulfovibrionaceae bacterium]|jgi:type II secretory pathway pseudopilin PulG|nr:prepilin-type N-terminal cleavage/methylation domain-containing protein [Desulfovibrionaceae bacterium]